MPYRVNFTQRTLISKRHITFDFQVDEEDRRFFQCKVDLSNYEIKKNLQPHIELYGQNARFIMPMVMDSNSKIATLVRREILPEELPQIPRYKAIFKVVSPVESRQLIFASRGFSLVAQGKQESLLPITESDGMGELIWRITYDDDGPLMEINIAVPEGKLITDHPKFASLVMPAVFERILRDTVLKQEDVPEISDENGWPHQWWLFANREFDAPHPSENESISDEEINEKLLEEIPNLAMKFADKHQSMSKWLNLT